MILATLGEVPRPVSRFSIVAVASISTSSFFDFFLEKNVYQTEPLLDQLSVFLTTQLKNELIRNSRECDSRKAETWSGYLSECSQTHSEKSRLDFLALRGKN